MAKKKRSPTSVVILTHAAIAAVFVVLIAGVFFYSTQTIMEQTRQADEAIAERTVQQAEKVIEDLFAQGEILLRDERILRFFRADPTLQQDTREEIRLIMSRANSSSEIMTDVFFCPFGPGIVLNGTGVHTGPALEKLLEDTLGISVQEWQERTSFAGKRSIQIVSARGEDGTQKRNFLLLLREEVSGNPGQEWMAAAVVPVSMVEDLSNTMRPDGYEDIIAEYPGGIYSFRREKAISREELEEAQKGSLNVFSLLLSGKPIHVTTREGILGDVSWRLHFFCPVQSYRGILLVSIRNFAISVLIILTLGSALLYFTLASQRRPLRILLDRISGKRGSADPALDREYRMIDQAITAMQEKQQGTENQLAEYRARLQNTSVYQLLRGTGIREKSLISFFRQHEIDLRSEQCRVLLLTPDTDEADALPARLLEDLENQIYQCLPSSFCIITDYCVECLICPDSETKDAEELRFMRDSLADYCRERNLHFYAALSKPETGTEGANKAFREAETILDHATMAGYRDVIQDELPEERAAGAKAGQETRRQQLLDYVNAHFADASLSVLQMADAFDMSPSSVSRTFRQAADTGLNTYIHTLRVNRAKELMETTQDSLKRISEKVGYGNQITMIRAFKKLEGITPQEYRTRIQGKN